MNNSEFAEKDVTFREACKAAGIPPSRRQASKYRLGFGKAYEHRHMNNGNGLDTHYAKQVND